MEIHNRILTSSHRKPYIYAIVSRSPWVHGSVAPDKRHCQQWMSSLFCGFLPHPFIQDLFLWRTSQEFVKTDLHPLSLISLPMLSVWPVLVDNTCRPLCRSLPMVLLCRRKTTVIKKTSHLILVNEKRHLFGCPDFVSSWFHWQKNY